MKINTNVAFIATHNPHIDINEVLTFTAKIPEA